MTLHLRTRSLSFLIVALVLLLALAGAVAGWSIYLSAQPPFHGLEGLFDLAAENNVPTWFSTQLLTLASLALVLVAARASLAGESEHWRWWLLAAAMGGFSLMEDASIVERVVSVTSAGHRFAVLNGYGSVAKMIAVALAAVLFVPLLGGQPRGRQLAFIAAGVLFVVGHAAFSRLGGWMVFHGGVHQPGFVLARVAEETVKMLGITLLLHATLGQLREGGELRLLLD